MVLCANSRTGGILDTCWKMRLSQDTWIKLYLLIIPLGIILNQSGVPDGRVFSHQLGVRAIKMVTRKDLCSNPLLLMSLYFVESFLYHIALFQLNKPTVEYKKRRMYNTINKYFIFCIHPLHCFIRHLLPFLEQNCACITVWPRSDSYQRCLSTMVSHGQPTVHHPNTDSLCYTHVWLLETKSNKHNLVNLTLNAAKTLTDSFSLAVRDCGKIISCLCEITFQSRNNSKNNYKHFCLKALSFFAAAFRLKVHEHNKVGRTTSFLLGRSSKDLITTSLPDRVYSVYILVWVRVRVRWVATVHTFKL